MKKLLILLLLSVTTIFTSINAQAYNPTFIENSTFNPINGSIESSGYNRTSKEIIVNNKIILDSNAFFQIMFWDVNGNYIGFMNSNNGSTYVEFGWQGTYLGTINGLDVNYPSNAYYFGLTNYESTITTSSGDIIGLDFSIFSQLTIYNDITASSSPQQFPPVSYYGQFFLGSNNGGQVLTGNYNTIIATFPTIPGNEYQVTVNQGNRFRFSQTDKQVPESGDLVNGYFEGPENYSLPYVYTYTAQYDYTYIYVTSVGNANVSVEDLDFFIFEYPATISLDSNYGDYFDEPIQFQDQDELYIDYPISAQSADVNDDWQATAPTSGIGSFVFQHWYDLDNQTIFSTNASLLITGPNRDYNLRAIYSGVNEYNIDLNMESGISGNIQYQGNSFDNNAITEVSNIIDQTVPDGTAWQANAPSVTGYNFDHWYNLNTNSIYSTNQSIIINDTTSNFNLEARYSPIPTYTFNATSDLPEPPNFTYSVNGVGQTATYPVNVTVEEGDSVSITAQTDNIGFYTFDDWYDLDNNSVITTSPTYNQPNILRNYNVIARYSLPEEYQIDLNLTSNIGNIQFQIDGEPAIIAPSISETVFAGTDWTANAPSAPTNYEFDGWFNVSDNSLFTTNTGFGVTNTQDDYNLIAQFTELFTLTFDSAGGSAINDLIERDGDSIDLPEPTREGFIFVGWYETSDPFQVVVNEPYTVTENVDFTARWIAIIEVSFNSNGGTPVPSQFVSGSGLITEPPIPSKFGYLFDGWYIDNNTFANEYDFTSPIPYTFDFSLHAKWVIGSDSDVDQTLSDWVSNSGLPSMVIVIVIMLAVTVTLGVINAQMFVIVITNVSLLFVFTSLGFIPLWILLVAGLAVLGFTIMMLFGGRTNA